ncbi:hypothetical protein [Sandarakinorhabdus sp.]|uniref:hypothetical protein n=1 Tax=Sandarakinorhabdus sp. TaxID=1916663 RepID=UPI00286E2A9F|nr:hypothetical protein [Sandarakinorhabdus sp.]
MRSMLATGLMLLATGVVMAGSYTVNLKASSERAAVTRLRLALVDDASRIRELEAELRTRARLPEMQRWNDMVLHMAAPQSVQFLHSPVQLASYAAQPNAPQAGGVPSLRYAVTGADGQALPAPIGDAPQTIAYAAPAEAEAGVIKAAFAAPVANALAPAAGTPAPSVADPQ